METSTKKIPDAPMTLAAMTQLRKTSIGDFLRRKRIAKRLTQAEVAAACGYTTAQFVSNWERGLSLPPTAALPVLTGLLEIAPSQMIQKVCHYEAKTLSFHRAQLTRVFREAGASA